MLDLIGNIAWAALGLLYLASETPAGLVLGLAVGLVVGVML